MGAATKTPAREFVQSLEELCDRGMFLDAWRQAETFAPIRNWTGIEACASGARVASNIGANQLASRLIIRAWRADRAHPRAQFYYGLELDQRRGPLALWRAMREWTIQLSARPEERAELLTIQARAAGELRDFATAEKILAEAEALQPDYAWIRLQRAHLLEWQDQPEAALELARAARALHPHPFHRPSVQTEAHLLQLLDRDAEAIELLLAANQHIQSGAVAVQCFALLIENRRWTEAEAALERYVELTPGMEKRVHNWVIGQRARVAYHRGARATAARYAGELEDPFFKAFSAKLAASPPEPERVQLDVTFVRQHFKTCAPATLAALGRFWQLPAEHLQLAEAMCYDGTPAWQQRKWAEENGWHVREFSVTRESATALILKGIPFAISTVEATSAHMQAVVGFDQTRNTLLLRDPGQPYVVEAAADEFFKCYLPFGPHGMVFVPTAHAGVLAGVALPDSEILDEHYRLWCAIGRHNHAAATTVLQRMESQFPEHRLTWEARLDLAGYDQNDVEQARCLDKLLEMFPDCAARQLRRYHCLRTATRQERIQYLEAASARKEADPALMIELARAFEGDARQAERGRYWLRRAMRYRPVDSKAITVLGNLLWESGALEDATELYRFAANLESFQEHLYQSWFVACQRTRRTAEALAHLQDRFKRFGTRSDRPALTLAWALRETEQPAPARDVLTEAMKLRPDDGYLLLRAAPLLANLGDNAEADRLFAAARSKVREADWLRGGAELAESRMDFATALRFAQDITACEPLALDAHGGIARAKGRLEGPAAALQHLQEACARFPQNHGLRRLLVEWSREATPDAAIRAIEDLRQLEPADAWALRELAVTLLRAGRGDEALQAANEAAQIEPLNSFSFSARGHIQHRRQDLAAARGDFRRAIELSVDNTDAIRALLDLARTDTERKEVLAFVESELLRQVVTGDGLLSYLDAARMILAPDSLLASLRVAHEERPDLWHVWSALVSQLGFAGKLEEALSVARLATERFSHLPRTWLDLAEVHQWRNEPSEELIAAERAFEINPGWVRSAIGLANSYERRGRMLDAGRVYERALLHSPLEPGLHAHHASLLWRRQRVQEAFTALERALRIMPGYDWAWDLMSTWAVESGQAGRTASFARKLADERPGEPRVWLVLARVLREVAPEERLEPVERALKLDPHSTEAWDLKAELLTYAERFDEAIEACNAGATACTTDLFVLQGRHAWVEAQRKNLPAAIDLMRVALTENASYLWGWSQLAFWLSENQPGEAIQAVENIIRLRPHDPWGHNRLGFLKLRQQDKEGARKAFLTAMDLAPTDQGAAENVFDLQLEAGDLEGATETLRRMQTHLPGARTSAAEIILQVRKREKQNALKLFEALCVSPDPDPWPVRGAAEALQRAGYRNKALRIIRQNFKKREANPQIAATAIELLMSAGQCLDSVWFFFELKPGIAQQRAASPLVHGLAEHRRNLLLRWLLWRRREVLFRDDAAWAKVGYALLHLNRPREAAAWLQDWPQRPNVQMYVLFNQCLALRQTGNFTEAHRIALHALNTWPHRDGADDLHLFLAVEEAIAGSTDAAEAHIAKTNVRNNVNYDQQMLALAKALVMLQRAPVAERRQAWKSVRRDLAEKFPGGSLASGDKDIRHTFRRAAKVARQLVGGTAGWWFGWKLRSRQFGMALLICIILAALHPLIMVAAIPVLVWQLRRG
jgi:tetratricopeptide (TPR) repeat protein